MSGTTGPPPPPELIAYSNARVLIAEAATLFSVATLTVLLRCYVRIVMLKSFGHDDWTMVLSGLMAMATLICYVLQVPVGLGKHLSVIQMDPVKYEQLLKIRYVHQIICGPAVTVVKISVALFLLRFATKKAYRMFLYGLIVFLLAFLLTCAGTLDDLQRMRRSDLCLPPCQFQIWACIPVAASWNYALRPPPLGNGNATCFSRDTFGRIALFNAVVNCATDFLLAFLPVPLIWQLKLNLRTRISLVAILSLGIFAGVAGIIRAMVFNSILRDPRRFIHDKYSMWNYVELTIGIIAGSLPALKPLFTRFLNTARGRTVGSSEKASANMRSGGMGYQRQYNDPFKSEIEMANFKGGNRASVAAVEKSMWATSRGNTSDESVAPLHVQQANSNGILVTRDFEVK